MQRFRTSRKLPAAVTREQGHEGAGGKQDRAVQAEELQGRRAVPGAGV